MSRLVRALSIVAAAALLTACSSMGSKIETPRLHVTGLAMTSSDVFSQNFLVRLNVQNPNDLELSIKGIEYKLFLQGDSFAEGTSSRGFKVPAKGETDFDMTVRTHFSSSIGRLLTRLNGRKQVEYIFEGKVLLQEGPVRSIPFQESGTADLATMR